MNNGGGTNVQAAMERRQYARWEREWHLVAARLHVIDDVKIALCAVEIPSRAVRIETADKISGKVCRACQYADVPYEPPVVTPVGNMHDLLTRVCAPHDD